MFDKTKLEVVQSGQTGSVFFVIGTKDDLNLSVRFWVDTRGAFSDACFRFRVSQNSQGVVALLYSDYVSERFPGVKWTGNSVKHVSLAGGVRLPCPAQDTNKLLNLLQTNMAGERLWGFMQEQFTGTEFRVSEAEFLEMFYGDLQASSEALSPLPSGSSAIVFDFGSYQKTFQNGFEVSAPQITHEEVALQACGLASGNGAGVVDPVSGGMVAGSGDSAANSEAIPATVKAIKKAATGSKTVKLPKGQNSEPQSL